jgi:dTDP-4-amino-4,6-dideoxygalactose transaminase
MNAKVSFLDIKQQHLQIKKELFEIFEQVIENTAFSGGMFVEKFEKAFATYCGTKYTVACNSGTSALHLAMRTLNIGSGDEVIVPANTFIATAWAISYVNAVPVFADCDPNTWEIDPHSVEMKITSKTKAIIGVHLYGQPFDLDALNSVAKKYQLYLIEDAAQAHGAGFKGKRIGSFSEMACFSFYPGKNLGACGEGGAIVTRNESYYLHMQALRNHGSATRYYHDELGYNMRMGGLEAASLIVKLKYIDIWNSKRKAIAKMYQEGIRNPAIKMQFQPEYSDSIYHLFVITTNDRNKLMKYLNEQNIFPGLHYPVPCHLQKAYSHLGYKRGDCPNSEYLSDHCLSLPMYAELEPVDVEQIIDLLNKYS